MARPSRREEILDRATHLIARSGYDGVSIRDLAEGVGLSKATIMHHFGSKDRLLEEVHARYMRRRLAEARLLLEIGDSAEEQLASLILHLMMVQQVDRDATVAFAREILRFAEDPVMSHVRQMRSEYTELVESVLQRGMDDGEFVRDEPRILTLMIFGMCNWSWTWFRPDGSASAEEIGGIFARNVLSAVLRSHDPSVPLDASVRRVREAMARWATTTTGG
jgi:TetR/AcrR family transcriptional regulator, cholesterol catabolism regulator